jgi:hypothetical protein
VGGLTLKELAALLTMSDALWSLRAQRRSPPTRSERAANPLLSVYDAVSRCEWVWKSPNVFLVARPVCGLHGFPVPLRLVDAAPPVIRSRGYASRLFSLVQAELPRLSEGSFDAWWEPIQRVFAASNGRHALRPAMKRALVQAFTGQLPTRAALHAWGYEVPPDCPLCDSGSPDTLCHRVLACGAAECVRLRGRLSESFVADLGSREPSSAARERA